MLWSRRFDGLDTLVAERGRALLGAAILLTGSRAAGEDLLQAALERLMRSWGRVRQDREGYLRRTMYHLAVDQWRRRRRRPEVFIDHELMAGPDANGAFELREALTQLLAQLPARQRAVLVLRYWEQLSEAETGPPYAGCRVLLPTHGSAAATRRSPYRPSRPPRQWSRPNLPDQGQHPDADRRPEPSYATCPG